MASIQRSGSKWRVQVYVQGKRASKTFATRKEAAQWAIEQEAQFDGRKLPNKTLIDAMRSYAKMVSPTHRGEHWEIIRLRAFEREPFTRLKLSVLNGRDFAQWRDTRLRTHMPSTVAREMNLLRSVLEYVRRDLQWLYVNPMADVRRPSTPKGRARRITAEEVQAITTAFGVNDQLRSDTVRHRVGLAFLFALETAMRSGEILGLRWANVYASSRYVVLPETKNGDTREVPLSSRAMEIIDALPRNADTVFNVEGRIRDAIWRKHRPSSITDLHFHDSRGEAIWRLSKKLDVLQLARMIGHRDPRSLMIYYRESAAEMAQRLD